MKELEDALATRKNNGPYLFGTQFTLADVCWVPILDRMDAARWWPEVDRTTFPKGNRISFIAKFDAISFLKRILV